MRKYNPQVGKKITVNGKEIVSTTAVDGVIKREIAGNGALGIRSLQDQILRKYYGISRESIRKYLQSDPILQQLRRRPAEKQRNREPAGKTEWVLRETRGGRGGKGYFDGINTLGGDLIQISDGTFPPGYKAAKYILTIVHKFSGFVWGYALQNSTSSVVSSKVMETIRKAEQRFGNVGHFETDLGSEFASHTAQKLNQRRNLVHSSLKLVSYVEAANSRIQRYLVFQIGQDASQSFTQALRNVVSRLNKIKNSRTGHPPDELGRGRIPLESITRKFSENTVTVNGRRRKRKNVNRARKRKGLPKWQPRKKKKRKFKVGDKVRVLRKAVGRKAPNYKSYQVVGINRNWSDPTKILKIHAVNPNKYQVRTKIKKKENVLVWRDAEDLIKFESREDSSDDEPIVPRPKKRKRRVSGVQPMQYRRRDAPGMGPMAALQKQKKRKQKSGLRVKRR